MRRDLSIQVKKKAYELGYDLCGIIEAKSFIEYIDYLDLRIKKFPDSAHLYNSLYNLGTPLKEAYWGKSIVVCVRRYNKYKIPQDLDKLFGKIYLFDGRLSSSKEYSNKALFEEYLKELGMKTFRNGVTARWAAVKAGLGHFGKNNFVYTKFGSWVWIDTWIVDFEMEYDKESEDENQSCPENCRRCIQACPTKALSDEFTMDRGVCIAQLSFYSTDLPSEDIMHKMGTWMYGCDVCQDVCPRNKKKWSEEEDFTELDSIMGLLSLEKILSMDETTSLEILHPRFWYISKDRIWLWKCNALRAMVNSRNEKYYQFIKDACNDNNDKVRTMALLACKRLDI